MQQEPLYYDVFNGDADGICALHQLRLHEPRQAQLVSGVKRDITLLKQLSGVRHGVVTVLDISLDRNREPLEALLETCRVCYIDHHFAGEIPASPNLETHIDPAPEVCTSLIVDRMLQGAYRAWAVVAAFGDNLHEAARRAAEGLGWSAGQLADVRELGELMNYNGYGRTLADLHFSPRQLYEAIQTFHDPLDFCYNSEVLANLRQGFNDDMARARCQAPLRTSPVGRIYRFPAEAWARRVAGVFSNEKAREMEHLAHALIVDNGDSTSMVSVRAPFTKKRHADTLCRAFPTGGGRAAAAGINVLPEDRLDEFIHSFEEVFA